MTLECVKTGKTSEEGPVTLIVEPDEFAHDFDMEIPEGMRVRVDRMPRGYDFPGADKVDWAAGEPLPEGHERFALFCYVHSGIVLRAGSFNGLLPQGHAQFDSWRCGVVDVALNEGETRMDAGERLDAFLKQYTMMLNRDWWRWRAERKCSACGQSVVEDCCGYLGRDDAVAAAREAFPDGVIAD